MSTPLRKVRTGAPLVIPAATYNAFVDAARDHQQRQHGAVRRTQRDVRQSDVVLVRNDSGADRDRFDVLGIAAPLVSPAENPDEFAARVALAGVTPTDNHADAFVVLLEPLAAGRIGRAAISGTTVARIDVLDAAHTHARAKAGDAAKLESAAAGAARILWVESGTGTRYGVVRFGGAAGGGVKCVVITAFGNNLGTNTTYVCRDIDAAGAATGDPFTVYVMTSPAHAADLTECYPNHDIGDFIRVREETNFLAGSLRTEWFCIDTLVQRECAGP